MTKLFLASSFKDAANIFVDFETDMIGKRVTFIPTASIVEKVDFFVAAARKALEKMGLIIDVLEISSASEEEIKSKLRENDYIYVSGGNTFYLLQELQRTGADKLIIEEVNKGKLYIGESAGAIIASNNIEYAKGMDSVKKAPNLQDYNALGLVEFYPLPHFNSFPFKKAVQKIIDTYSSELDFAIIGNHDAITVQKNKMEIVRG